MSKKLLAALIAFAMVGAFGCDEKECEDKAKQCAGTMPQMCINGAWVDGSSDCGALGCNAATGTCNTSTNNNGGNNGGNNGDNTGNNTGNGGNNTGNGGNNTGDAPVAGASCDPSTYEGGCSADGSKRYYCGSDNTLVEKPCDSGKTCVVKGSNSSKCEGGSTDNCTPSGNEADNCNDGKDNDCNGFIDADDFACAPDCTATSTSTCKKACNAEKTAGYYFSKGEVKTVECPNADCNIADNKVVCGEGSGSGNTDNCNKTEDKETSCSDGVDNDCDGWIDSKDYDCGNSSSSETCTDANSVGKCADDKATAVVCSNGVVKTWTCFNNYCEVNATTGVVSCPKDQAAYDRLMTACTGDVITEGGVEGNCCDQNTYNPSGCDTATNSGLRCDSTGKVTTWTCSDGKTCNFDPESTKYPGGEYSCK